MLNVTMLSVAFFIVMLRVIMLRVVMLRVVMLSVVMLSVVMLSVVAPFLRTFVRENFVNNLILGIIHKLAEYFLGAVLAAMDVYKEKSSSTEFTKLFFLRNLRMGQIS
jgi:hypothetical protein